MKFVFHCIVGAVVSSLLLLDVHAASGDLDLSFDANLGNSIGGMTTQPDGKILIGITSATAGTVPPRTIARLHADGTTDTDFSLKGAGTASGAGAVGIALKSDGQIVIAGLFGFNYNSQVGYQQLFIARLDGDGTLDLSFNALAPRTNRPNGALRGCLIQPDGKIVFWGDFTTWGGLQRNCVARTLADGTLDMGFNPNVTFPSGSQSVNCVIQQPDGKLIVGGNFSTVGGVTRYGIARIGGDGSLDTDFDPSVTFGQNTPGSVFCALLQPDGKILIGGSFITVAGVARSRIARLSATGTLDLGFNPNANDRVLGMALQADGRIIITGDFGAVGGIARTRIARLNADGTLGSGFNPGLNNTGFGISVLQDGKVLVRGGFFNVGGVPRNSLARLQNDAATQSLTLPSAGHIQWLRGGASPEVGRVTFELSTDGGGTWSGLGDGMRISGGWELTSPSLPAAGSIRARGYISDGNSLGMVESAIAFSPADANGDALLDAWQLTYWPTTAGHSATDDSDHDGLTELQELAFGLNPTVADSALAPVPVAEGGYLTITLTKHPGAAYEVQSAGTLLGSQPASFSPATATVLLDTATTLKVRDNVLIGTPPARFLRVKVIAAP